MPPPKSRAELLAIQHRPGVKCCPDHIGPTNRAARRAADRWCSCRGECGYHGRESRTDVRKVE